MVVQQEYNADFVDWRGQNFFKLDWLLENNAPVDYPLACDTVYGVVDCAQKGDLQHDGSACIWFAPDTLPVRTGDSGLGHYPNRRLFPERNNPAVDRENQIVERNLQCPHGYHRPVH